MAERKNTIVAGLALAWLLQQPIVTSIILGANKLEQLQNNIKALEIEFSESELLKIETISVLVPEYLGNVIDAMSGDQIIR